MRADVLDTASPWQGCRAARSLPWGRGSYSGVQGQRYDNILRRQDQPDAMMWCISAIVYHFLEVQEPCPLPWLPWQALTVR